MNTAPALPPARRALRASLATACLALAGAALAQTGGDALFRAIRQDSAPAVRQLLESGQDPNQKDERGTPGLVLALQEDALKAAAQLLQSPRLHAETRNAQGESPLMIAALKGRAELAQALIEKGADVNKTGWTPLHYAATGGHLDIVRLLLEAHAYIDAASPNGSTPLMMAAMYGNADTVQLLLDEGADPNLRNQLGLSALDFAQKGERPDAAERLRAAIRAKAGPARW